MINNNNPGNLRYLPSIPWQGLADPPSNEQGFCNFITAAKGLRALAIDLRNQQTEHGLRTISKIITKYAPPNDNQTIPYILDVSRRTTFGPAKKLDLTNRSILAALMKAIIWHENGSCPYTDEQIAAAVAEALPEGPQPMPSKKPITPQGAAAASGAAGLIMVIAHAELQRHNIKMDDQELLAIMGLLAPTIHQLSRIVQAVTRHLVLRLTGVDIDKGGEVPGPLAGSEDHT